MNPLKLMAVVFILIFSCSSARAEHSFDVLSVTFTKGGANIVGTPTSVISTNLEMEARVCDLNNTVMYAGNRHTFTSVGEQFTFTVKIQNSNLTLGEDVLIAVTDNLGSTDCNNGIEGYNQPWVYFIETIPVPTLGLMSSITLILLLTLLGGMTIVRRQF